MDSQSVADFGPTSMNVYPFITNVIIQALSLILPKNYLENVTIFLQTLPRDIKFIYVATKVMLQTYFWKKINCTAVSALNSCVKKHPEKPCLIFEDQVWTFREVNNFANKIAQIFERAGFKKGDIVALVMTNRPEYCCIWNGLGKIGVVTAFINTNLKSLPLIHCIKAANCKGVVYSSDLAEVIKEVRSSLDKSLKYFEYGSTTAMEGTVNLTDALQTVTPAEPMGCKVDQNDHFVYVYTSGTTGLPKAAIIPHSRYIMMAIFWKALIGLKEDDVVYDPLPLYHSAGGLLGVGAAFVAGGTVVIKKKFSASNYIEDCIKYKCTMGQYIGEMCRYILAVPEKPTDKQHKLKLLVGNGLRPSIWSTFVKRFNIPNIMEIYGSTEGNLQFVNMDNTIGAVGLIPRFLPYRRYIGAVIKVDSDTMEPIRDSNGLCIECPVDEPGMFVGLIRNDDAMKDFHGYLDKKESKKKYVYDVFSKGDKAFVSGDIVVIDKYGYLYFKDRTGDTFRWKGENVSTSEVEAVISSVVGLRDCVVYGVQIGELEGRAGMVAIVDTSGSLDLANLPAELDKHLPKYAQPIFVRILKEVELTGTFKLKKMTLVKEGFDPAVVKDSVYVRKGASYIPVTQELHDKIVSGAIPV